MKLYSTSAGRHLTSRLLVMMLLLWRINNGNSASGDAPESVQTREKTTLHVLVLAPYPNAPPYNPSWEGGPAVVPSALVAIDYINKREDILPEYVIEAVVNESGCNIIHDAGVDLTHSIFYSGKNIVGIVGPGCSETTLAVSPLLTNDRISLIEIAPSATSPLLTNVVLYPNTFRPVASALGFVSTFTDIIVRNNYKQIGAVYEADRAFQTAVYTKFESEVQMRGISVSSIGIFNTSLPIIEFRFKVRVIFVFASTGFARIVLCLASKLGMLYPDYQFIFSNRRPSNFMTDVNFRYDLAFYSCSRNEMEAATVGVIFNNFRLTRQDRDTITDAGISYNHYIEEYNRALALHLNSHGLTRAINTEHHNSYFDAMWALGLSLNNSVPRLEERGLSLSDYKYRMPEITQIVREELLKLNFEGMRGRVDFSEETLDCALVTVIDIYQVVSVEGNSIYGSIGHYDPSVDTPLVLYPNASLIQADFSQTYAKPHLSLGIIAIVLIVVLYVILAACHIANVAWSNYLSVKASSPNMNHLIFSSCYLSLFGAFMYTNAFIFINITTNIDILIPVHCSALQWSSTMSYSLLFGTLCAKRWRVYRIFNTFVSSPIKRLSDTILVCIVLIPLNIDVVLNVLWNVIDPWHFRIKRGPGFEALATCETNGEIVWAICIVIPKGILTIVVLYLAVATRRVHKREFKQTKSINILIFSVLIITGISLPLFIILQFTVLPWAISVSYVSFCFLYLGPVVLCIIHVLLPPLIPPLRHKMGLVMSDLQHLTAQ